MAEAAPQGRVLSELGPRCRRWEGPVSEFVAWSRRSGFSFGVGGAFTPSSPAPRTRRSSAPPTSSDKTLSRTVRMQCRRFTRLANALAAAQLQGRGRALRRALQPVPSPRGAEDHARNGARRGRSCLVDRRAGRDGSGEETDAGSSAPPPWPAAASPDSGRAGLGTASESCDCGEAGLEARFARGASCSMAYFVLLPMTCRLFVDEVGNGDLNGAATDPNIRYLSLTGIITKQRTHAAVIQP